MTRRCFLHVGSPKTGTTYLQNVLYGSRAALRQQGLTVPLRRRDHFSLTLHAREGLDPELDPPDVGDVHERLVEALARHDRDVVISHELFCVATPSGIARLLGLFGDFEIHLVLTARDWRRQLPAEWQQFVKTRFLADYETYLRGCRDDPADRVWEGQDYAGILARWSADVPAERVHVVTVPPSGTAPDLLLQRFCSVLGVDAGPLGHGPHASNASLSWEATELMRRVNLTLGDRLPKPRTGYNRVAKFWFAERVLSTIEGTRLFLPDEHQQWCHERSVAQVESLREAGYHVVGDLDELVPPPEPAGRSLPVIEDRAQLAIALEAIVLALVQRLEDVHEIDALRALQADP